MLYFNSNPKVSAICIVFNLINFFCLSLCSGIGGGGDGGRDIVVVVVVILLAVVVAVVVVVVVVV